MFSGVPVNKLKLQAAKLHSDAGKCGLAMMSCIFTPDELVNGNLAGVSNSKEEARKKGIKQLDPNRMKFIQSKTVYSYLSSIILICNRLH